MIQVNLHEMGGPDSSVKAFVSFDTDPGMIPQKDDVINHGGYEYLVVRRGFTTRHTGADEWEINTVVSLEVIRL